MMRKEGEERGYSIRQRRVGELLAKEISIVLQQRALNPRLSSVVITGVRMSRDLRLATVYFGTAMQEDRAAALEALVHSASFIRRELAARVYLRYVPALRFRIDNTYDRAQRIERLLTEVMGERRTSDGDSAAAGTEGPGSDAPAS